MILITKILQFFSEFFTSLFSWLSTSIKQTSASYCELQTADSPTVLVANDGSLISILRIEGVTTLIGQQEFDHIQNAVRQSLQTTMSQPGHVIQVLFTYDKDEVQDEISHIFSP